MSHYTVLYKYDEHTRNFWTVYVFIFIFSFLWFEGVFNKTIIPHVLVGYEMIIGSFRLDCEYEIEYEHDFRISNQRRFQSPRPSYLF